jgi:hypothetical protein
VNDRKWICSVDAEYWSCPKQFDTRDAAIAYAITELANQRGLEEGRCVYTGEVRHLSADQLIDRLDVRRVVFAIESLLRDTLGSDFDYSSSATDDQRQDLVKHLASAARKWFASQKVTGKAWIVQHVRSHVWISRDGVRLPVDQ